MVHARCQHQDLRVETKLNQRVGVSGMRCVWLGCPVSHLLHTGREMGTAENLSSRGKEVGAGTDGGGLGEGGDGCLLPYTRGFTYITDTLR